MKVADVSSAALAKVFEPLDWADINTLCEAAIAGGVFTSGFYKKCVDAHAKTVIRRMLKSGRLKDSEGNVINVASIMMKDKTYRDQVRRVYKREDLFTESDFIQVMFYHKGRAKMHLGKMKYYKRRAIEKFGERIQTMLPGFED